MNVAPKNNNKDLSFTRLETVGSYLNANELFCFLESSTFFILFYFFISTIIKPSTVEVGSALLLSLAAWYLKNFNAGLEMERIYNEVKSRSPP